MLNQPNTQTTPTRQIPTHSDYLRHIRDCFKVQDVISYAQQPNGDVILSVFDNAKFVFNPVMNSVLSAVKPWKHGINQVYTFSYQLHLNYISHDTN